MAEFAAQVVLGDSRVPVGQLRFTAAGPRQFSTFAYDAAWIENPRAFAVQPDLPLEGGPFHTSGQPGNMRDALAGVFADAAPGTVVDKLHGLIAARLSRDMDVTLKPGDVAEIDISPAALGDEERFLMMTLEIGKDGTLTPEDERLSERPARYVRY